jgi:hypothetical protein
VIRLVALVAGGLLALAAAGCGGGVARGAYVKANERLFAKLPSFPDAQLESETSTAYRSTDTGPVLGYGTRFELKLPTSATAPVVSSFFRQHLQPRWRLVETDDSAVFNFRQGEAFVSINLENAHIHVLEVAVDHAYYGKLGR